MKNEMKKFHALIAGIVGWSIISSLLILVTILLGSNEFSTDLLSITMWKLIVLTLVSNLILNLLLIKINYYE